MGEKEAQMYAYLVDTPIITEPREVPWATYRVDA
jgi:hypothetical protein